MELPRRDRNDVFLPDGAFRRATEILRRAAAAHELRIGIVYAFDFRTRMLPYWYADARMAPCSVRTLADVLNACGFRHIRVILQQWTPDFRPSAAEIHGEPLDILLVSAMQVHAEPAYDLIRDAHHQGASRPLILAGGPKAIYEPTDYFELGPAAGVGADCVMTGEAYVLLAFLDVVLQHRARGESIRAAFERARRARALDTVSGLVYLDPDCAVDEPVAINTGVQRLVRDLDEMPPPDAGFRLLEPPHRGRKLRPQPLSPKRVGRRSPIASVISTQGCKFNCSYCPIPAANQRTWRHKSPQRFAEEIKSIHENFGISSFFGTDDNFFNRRETVVDLMTELARTQTERGPLGRRIQFYTEATQLDVHKNQDLLPLCRDGGMRAIWFGIEDITAELVNKGQTAGATADLFALLRRLGIEPMAMMIHSDDQPLRGDRGDLSALLNQARYLFDKGAVSYQCTYLGPSVGTRDFETAVTARALFKSVGGVPIPEAFYDGNHVVASRHPRPWQRQLNLLRAYGAFYNPINTMRAIAGLRRDVFSWKRLAFQIIGQIGLVMTVPKLLRWARQLRTGPIERWDGLQPAAIPMVDAADRLPMDWAIERPRKESDYPALAHRGPAVETGDTPATIALPVLSTV